MSGFSCLCRFVKKRGNTPSRKWELSWPAQVAQVKNSAAGCVLVQAVSATSGWKQLFAVLFTFF